MLPWIVCIISFLLAVYLQKIEWFEISNTFISSQKSFQVFMTLSEARNYCDQEEVTSSSGLLYGLMWFFKNRMPVVSGS